MKKRRKKRRRKWAVTSSRALFLTSCFKEREMKRNNRKATSKPSFHHTTNQLPASGHIYSASGYFSFDLEKLIQALNYMVPSFVEKCANFIEENCKSRAVWRHLLLMTYVIGFRFTCWRYIQDTSERARTR